MKRTWDLTWAIVAACYLLSFALLAQHPWFSGLTFAYAVYETGHAWRAYRSKS